MRFFVTAVLVIAGLGALALGIISRIGGPGGVALVILFGIWCFVLSGFLNFRRRVSTRARRAIVVVLALFPVGFYFAWTHLWRLDTYLDHRNWIAYESKHFVFHYAPNYPRADGIAAFASIRDKAFEENRAYLQVLFQGKTDFYVYEKLDEGFAVPDWNVIFSDDDQSAAHEMTHIIAYHICGHRQKIRLLDEGAATWLNHSAVTKDHHAAAMGYIRTNGLLPLSELAGTKTFRKHQPPPYYPAASFVGYLIERYGLDRFRRLWTVSAGYSETYSAAEELNLAKHFRFIPGESAHFVSAISIVYVRSLNTLDAEWRTWLESRSTN